MRKKIAFTLAEILIVMGVIGVVAALTLPGLNMSTGDKKTVAKVQKMYADLSDGYGRARAVYGPLNGWFINDDIVDPNSIEDNDEREKAVTKNSANVTKRISQRLTENFKVVKQCEATALTPCWNANQINAIGVKLSGKKYWNCEDGLPFGMVLADGSSLVIRHYYGDAYVHRYLICADVDGPNAGPNAWGKDLFIYWFNNEEGIQPGGWDHTGNEKLPCGSDNDTCTMWVIQKGNMEYTKTSDGKSCKNNSKVLTWDGASTCD